MDPVLATFAVLSHAHLGALLGTDGATLLRDRVTSVSHSVPVYELGFEPTFKRLPEVVERLREWHGAFSVDAEME